jgi:hypothetical protein
LKLLIEKAIVTGVGSWKNFKGGGPLTLLGGDSLSLCKPSPPPSGGGGGIQKSRQTPCWQSRPRRGWGFYGPLGHTPGENGGGSYPLLPPGVTFGGLSSPLSPGDSRQGWPPSSPLGNPKHTSRHEPRGRHVPPHLPLPSPLITALGPVAQGWGGRRPWGYRCVAPMADEIICRGRGGP